MIWTKGKPTEAGWYWIRCLGLGAYWNCVAYFDAYTSPQSLRNIRIPTATSTILADVVIDLLDIEWAGPLPEPEERNGDNGRDS